MKPFDLEAAKRGEPIVCRDGTPAKFIAHVPELENANSVLCLVEKRIKSFNPEGFYWMCDETPLDLFMASKKRTVDQNLINEIFEYRDGHLFWKNPFGYKAKAGEKAGSINQEGYVKVQILGKRYSAHRIIFCMFHGYFPEFVDHIDGNPQNNLIENLRECTKSQNSMNKKMDFRNSSGVKGVSFNKKLQKYVAYIKVEGKRQHLGVFESANDASNVVSEYRNKLHGLFANDGIGGKAYPVEIEE